MKNFIIIRKVVKLDVDVKRKNNTEVRLQRIILVGEMNLIGEKSSKRQINKVQTKMVILQIEYMILKLENIVK